MFHPEVRFRKKLQFIRNKIYKEINVYNIVKQLYNCFNTTVYKQMNCSIDRYNKHCLFMSKIAYFTP